MPIRPIFVSMALHTGVGLAGACAGDVVAAARQRGRFEFARAGTSPDSIVGAIAAPSVYHLAAPIVAHGRAHGGAAALRAAPPLLLKGLATGGLFGGAGAAGAIVAATLTDDGLRRGSLTALPPAAAGAIAGPVLCAGMRGALGPVRGSLAFVALAAALVKWQASRGD